MCTHSVGREFRKGTEKVACLCFMMSGASVGKIYKARDDSKGGGLEHQSSQGSTSNKMAYSPTRQSGLLGLMTGTPLHGLSTWLLTAQWLRPESDQTDRVFQESEHSNTSILCWLRCSNSHWDSRERDMDSHHLTGGHDRRVKEFVGVLKTLLLKRVLRRTTCSAPSQICSG